MPGHDLLDDHLNPMDANRLWLVGCGVMGGALLGRWRLAGMPDSAIVVVDPRPTGLPSDFAGILVTDTVDAMSAGPPDVVVLGVKPQLVAEVAGSLREVLTQPYLLVSMMAGVRTATLASLLPVARIARIMPNMAARVGEGVTAAFLPVASVPDQALLAALMRAAGPVVWLDDEQRFDAVTAISGSGPAFLFRFIEVLAGAGEAAGLDPDMAVLLARQTMIGAAALLREGEASPAELRAAVTSPNGTTQAGLDALDGDGALSALIRLTVRAAADRSRVLAAQADAVLGEAPRPPAKVAARG
jgi:pyrroline-5-carboxylate reductase